MATSSKERHPSRQPGKRKRIGLVDTEPQTSEHPPEGLTPQQQALREATIRNFKANKVKEYIATQVEYINATRQIGEAIRFLMDSSGRLPANAPLEDIIAEREKMENQIKWLEAICSELRINITKIKEIEESAFEMIAQKQIKQ